MRLHGTLDLGGHIGLKKLLCVLPSAKTAFNHGHGTTCASAVFVQSTGSKVHFELRLLFWLIQTILRSLGSFASAPYSSEAYRLDGQLPTPSSLAHGSWCFQKSAESGPRRIRLLWGHSMTTWPTKYRGPRTRRVLSKEPLIYENS